MTLTEGSTTPEYTGLRKYVSKGGFALWYPMGWREIPMTGEHNGAIITPYEDHYNTCFAVEKMTLPYEVEAEDVPTLRKGMEEGLNALPGIQIESIEVTPTATLIILDAIYSYLEGDARRKRWLRNIYWNEAQLVVIAQGQTVEEYELYKPVFFNSMMTLEVGSPF